MRNWQKLNEFTFQSSMSKKSNKELMKELMALTPSYVSAADLALRVDYHKKDCPLCKHGHDCGTSRDFRERLQRAIENERWQPPLVFESSPTEVWWKNPNCKHDYTSHDITNCTACETYSVIKRQQWAIEKDVVKK